MKPLIIWNEDSTSIITDAVAQQYAEMKSAVIIENWDQWMAFRPAKHEITQIFVLVDLYWTNQNYEGYEVATKIMQRWPSELMPPNMQFFSFFTRRQLYDRSLGVHKFFAKSFQHHLLTDDFKLSLEPFSDSKWQYLKHYALTESGILDKIKHDLDREMNRTVFDPEGVASLLDRLREIEDFAGDEIVEFLKQNHRIEETDQNRPLLLSKLHRLLVNRIIDLTPRDKQLKVSLRKPKVLLLEDDSTTLGKLESLFSDLFDTASFQNGKECLDELTMYGRLYQGIIADLELLDETKKLDQAVQGIEVLEYAEKHHPHIARRVITGLGRNGIKKLLPDMMNQDILYKMHLEVFGRDEFFIDFVEKMRIDMGKRRAYLWMAGPDNTYWGEKPREKGMESNVGGIKRFYYELKITDELAFNKMWGEIVEAMQSISNQNLKISAKFGKLGSFVKKFLQLSYVEKIEFLKRLLINRLVWLMRFRDGDLVYYRNEHDKVNSMSHQPCWEDGLLADPTVYLSSMLGLGVDKVREGDKASEDERATTVSLYFKRKELFPEENKYLLKFAPNQFGKFFQDFPELCESLFWAMKSVEQDQKTVASSFKRKYPERPEYLDNIEEDYALKALRELALESKIRRNDATREDIAALFNEFKYDKDGDETKEFHALPLSMVNLINEILQIF